MVWWRKKKKKERGTYLRNTGDAHLFHCFELVGGPGSSGRTGFSAGELEGGVGVGYWAGEDGGFEEEGEGEGEGEEEDVETGHGCGKEEGGGKGDGSAR